MLNYVIYLVSKEGYTYLSSKSDGIMSRMQNHGLELQMWQLSKKYEEDVTKICYNGNCSKENLLVISDDNTVLQILKRRGFPAVGFYHDGNRAATFEGISYAVTDVEDLTYRSYEQVYRRLQGLPWDILETGRLCIRESTVEDVEAFYRIYSDPSITEYMEDLFQDPARERAYMQDYIKQMYGFYGFGMWTVTEKEEGKIVGRAGLNVREGYDLPELGFVIDKRYQQRGYAEEACRAILNYAKEELDFDFVQALVIKENLASMKLLDKLGFVYIKDVTESGQVYRLNKKTL